MTGKSTKKAALKQGIKFTERQVVRFLTNCSSMACCGIQEYEGTESIRNPSDAKAIRRAAALVTDGGNGDGSTGSGYVLVSAVGREIARIAPMLTMAGFKKISAFTNGRTGSSIQLWGAKTLKTGPGGNNDVMEAEW